MGSSRGGHTGGLGEKVTLHEENNRNANKKSCQFRASVALICTSGCQ